MIYSCSPNHYAPYMFTLPRTENSVLSRLSCDLASGLLEKMAALAVLFHEIVPALRSACNSLTRNKYRLPPS